MTTRTICVSVRPAGNVCYTRASACGIKVGYALKLENCMNTFRTLASICIVSLVAACASAPKKETAPPPAPTAPAAPAINLTGNWILTVDSQMGSQDMKMTVNQSGSNLNGTMESQMGSVNYT